MEMDHEDTIIPDAVQESYPESQVPNAEDGADEGPVNPPKRSTVRRYRKPVRHHQMFRAYIPREQANTMSFEDVLKLGMQLVSVNKTCTLESLLAKKMDSAVGYFSRGYHPEINLLNFRLSHLKNLMNYINSPFPRFMFLPHEFTSTEIPKNEVIEKVGQLDSEITTMVLKDAEDLSELYTRAKTGVTKIHDFMSRSNEDGITGTEERMEQVQEELLEQIKRLLEDMTKERKILRPHEDFLMEAIKTGVFPTEKIGEVNAHIVSMFVNERQLLRLRTTGTGKFRLTMTDFNN